MATSSGRARLSCLSSSTSSSSTMQTSTCSSTAARIRGWAWAWKPHLRQAWAMTAWVWAWAWAMTAWVWVTMAATGSKTLLSSQYPLAQGQPVVGRLPLSPLLIVFFGGANLILIQWVLVREMTALLFGTELVVLLVSVAYFLGLSVGYVLSGRIRRAWLAPLAIITLVLHLTLPIWFRLLVVELDAM